MQKVYQRLGVPFSSEKSTTREERCEKLGAFMDGTRGVLGVTSTRSLDFLSLGFFMFGQDRIPTKWIQIVLEKFVHFQEATFHLCEAWLEKDSFLLRCWAVGAS